MSLRTWIIAYLLLLASQFVAIAETTSPVGVDVDDRQAEEASYATSSASHNPVDRFVRKRHRVAGVHANPPADRATLIRRLSLSLNGLPPTPDEVDAFTSDRSPDAYERLVDRLLASPRFGERMAQFWLDLARYADSDGYHDDTNRSMWPYRDYVIQAFNSCKPFDDFTVEQLAGDLLPNANLEQQVATAFHRNAPTSSEDGANPEEYRARYAVDRVNTTSQVWLGLTVQCAECHDHKYDPITMKDYYRLFAFFNQSPELPLFRGLYAPPSIAVPNASQAIRWKELQEQISDAEKAFQQTASDANSEFVAWVESLKAMRSAQVPRDAVACEYLFEDIDLQEQNEHAVVANTGTRRRAAKLIRRAHDGVKCIGVGPFGECLHLRGDAHLDLGRVFEVRPALPFSIETWLKGDGTTSPSGPLFSTVDDENDSRGFEVRVVDGRIVVRLIETWPNKAIQVATVGAIERDRWTHLSITFDGRLAADAIYIYLNGRLQDLRVDRQASIETIRNRSAFLVGGDSKDRFSGLLDELRFYNWPLPSEALQQLPVRGLIALQEHADTASLRHYFDCSVHPATIEAKDRWLALERERQLFEQGLPRVRVMQDAEERRPTHVLLRGDFRARGERVEAGTPEMFSALPALGKNRDHHNRLDLARWLIRENKQHTATVLANRLWALFFHRGIVSTLDDFGVMGASPTHPELLDWLRDELLRTDWDIKSVVRKTVLSATFRQSSRASLDKRTADPDNEWLSRGPRQRMSAEMIRDNALAVSGLLSRRIGGPSVRPYQPAGLWQEMSKGDEQAKRYEQSHGEALYRRGIYTFWKRSIHYPSFAAFDAPSREVCTSSRPTTNTPTQALTLLNDIAFVEAARAFAYQIAEHAGDFESRVCFAFRKALSRAPTSAEIEILRKVFDDVQLDFQTDAEAARKLVSVGEYQQAEQQSSRFADVEIATWTTIAQILLTSDEAISIE